MLILIPHENGKGKQKIKSIQFAKEIKRQTRRKFTAEEKIKIVLEAMRGEETIISVCPKYAIHQNNYFKWSKEFIEDGKRRLSGDTLREANRDEVKVLRKMNDLLKRELGELYVENKELKKTLTGLESENRKAQKVYALHTTREIRDHLPCRWLGFKCQLNFERVRDP
jgi:transposase